MFYTRLSLTVIPLCVALSFMLPIAALAEVASDIAQALAKAEAPIPDGYVPEGLGDAPGIAPDYAPSRQPGYPPAHLPGYVRPPGHDSASRYGCGDSCSCGPQGGGRSNGGCGPACGCGQCCGPTGDYGGGWCDPGCDCGPLWCNYPSDCDRWYIGFSTASQYRDEDHAAHDRWTFIKFEEGFQANAAIGYALDSCRVEFETSFMNNDIDRAGFAGFSSSSTGNANIRAFMFNVYRDFRFFDCCWEPYIGVGIGVYQSELNGFYPRFFDWVGEPLEGSAINATSDMPLAYQLRAGVSRPIGRRTEFYSGYRYFRGDDVTFSTAPYAQFDPTLKLDGAELHALELGLRVRF